MSQRRGASWSHGSAEIFETYPRHPDVDWTPRKSTLPPVCIHQSVLKTLNKKSERERGRLMRMVLLCFSRFGHHALHESS
jgi:hypothetical protein